MNRISQHWLMPVAISFCATALSAAPGSAQQLAQRAAPLPIVQEAVPYRPIPPGGAAYTMLLPPLQADGQRTTLNSNLDANATLWHFRSAWNVAALNCLQPDQAPILIGYSAFLRKFSRPLAAANSALDEQFVRARGSRNAGIKAREAYMTQVYNYFALPPAQTEFCGTALAIANDFIATPPADANDFAAANLARYEAVFQNFFRQYQQYQVDSAAWDERWGAMYGTSQPGYLAVHGILGSGLSASRVDLDAAAQTEPATSGTVPEGASTPAFQPILVGERG